MQSVKRLIRGFSASAIFILLFAPFAVLRAQDSAQSAPKGNSGTQDNSKPIDQATGEPASPIGLAWADSYFQQIGSAGLLAGNREGIGWGSFYIPSASATGLVDRFDATGTVPAASYYAAVFQTQLVYDRQFKTSRIAIQYSPSMAVVDGQVVGNYSNQNTSLDILLYARPRWNVRFGDSFTYYYSQKAYGTSFFDVNPTSGGIYTASFLNGPARWMSNSAHLSLAYALSRRSSISITPLYTYSESGTEATKTIGTSYGGTIGWNYRTSEQQSVGLEYNAQLIHETFGSSSTSVGAPPADTFHQTISGTAARQLTSTLLVRGSAGVTTSSYSQSGQNPRQWSFAGSLGVVQKIGRSSLGLNYSRGDTLSYGLVSSQYADRVDATFTREVTHRLGGSFGGGYLRQVGGGGFSGWYSRADVQFLLAPRAGLFSFFDYSHNNQGNGVANLYAGSQDYFTFGIRWQPGRITH